MSILENLFDTHPPFQMDGSWDYSSGVTEMWRQSHLQEGGVNLIQLLPALPKAWSDGSVTGLRPRGGFVVNMTWKQGKLTSATIHSLMGSPCRAGYADHERELRVPGGPRYAWQIGNQALPDSSHRKAP